VECIHQGESFAAVPDVYRKGDDLGTFFHQSGKDIFARFVNSEFADQDFTALIPAVCRKVGKSEARMDKFAM
jgi:hypothetical protein